MKKQNTLKIWEISLLLSLCVSLLLGAWAQARQEELSSNLLRLHVLAVSDDETEQAIKLEVRDSVLAFLAPKLEGVKTPDEAKKVVEENLPAIRAAAMEKAESRPVTVTLTQEYYPTREYENFSLPAGKYDSLRVILGEGRGHNWWCVVFPPLCLTAVESQEAMEALNPDDYKIVSGDDQYQIKFRLLELWGELMAKLNKA